jgi:hypothetical protein
MKGCKGVVQMKRSEALARVPVSVRTDERCALVSSPDTYMPGYFPYEGTAAELPAGSIVTIVSG